ncbi:hypothetical protein Mia14_0485 [Candidatus Mancarchaeum acidiphilum]|uniref:Uncharacterized protein n=1 Tax=Candidatus Mancarchaeum acidiphilum TaxID=1920749 RepID=A0A218NMU4_9ARCH|nr:hypothetical protein [Candidatus Mancarchaeum acidiphilum]ASI13799.1 hypothetical protein Mia14_0485 [Candidatus Mancarchaeum acidiphilum]
MTVKSKNKNAEIAKIIRANTEDRKYISENNYQKTYLGKPIVFYLPSIKIETDKDRVVEDKLDMFLLKEFGGYTAEKGFILGYWMDGKSVDHTNHIKYTVAVKDNEKIKKLESFIADIGKYLSEKAVYFEMDKSSWLIYPGNEKKN